MKSLLSVLSRAYDTYKTFASDDRPEVLKNSKYKHMVKDVCSELPAATFDLKDDKVFGKSCFFYGVLISTYICRQKNSSVLRLSHS